MEYSFIHLSGIYFFTKGFLLSRLVLEDKSACAQPPLPLRRTFPNAGTPEAGCWHPKTFSKAVVIVIDALRYDFTTPYNGTEQAFHNVLPFMHDTAVKEPHNAFLLPFIADAPTATLQRLKGLTTGTLPTFVDAGSSFSGTAIEEDNLLAQLRDSGRRIVHLGDDTWTALFPGYFEEGLSKAYDSFNVEDLHTVDNGVNEHLIPLLGKEKRGDWDVIFAHYLGVDHAGHRYGPNHPAMTAKLAQMNSNLKDIVTALDDETLLVVMGDHGMDAKGDHGGESDDEVQAALWMYSQKGVFGRTDPSFKLPPENAKIRPVNQIDLVPTLALLLGIPIPFNNLGKPIEEAFAGKKGDNWGNLADVVRMSAAGTKRYQEAYYQARGIDASTIEGSPRDLWGKAENATSTATMKESYSAFSAYQEETLRVCKSLWARFDVRSMGQGIGILAAGLLMLILYSNSNSEDGDTAEAPELTQAELELELEAFEKGDESGLMEEETTTRGLVRGVLIGTGLGALGAPAIWIWVAGESYFNFMLGLVSISGLVGALYQELRRRMEFANPLPTSFWGWTSVIFTLAQSIGFASNSYTIWEDSILLFFISSFGLVTAISSLRLERAKDRTLGIYHSSAFVVLGWIASFSKLCREEQMPYCKSTFYASATSSTSAPWQLIIPITIAIILPSLIKSYYTSSKSYEGLAPIWINYAFRGGLVLNAIFWILSAADDGEWLPSLKTGLLKNMRVPIAQLVFVASAGIGITAFVYAPPCVSILTNSRPATTQDVQVQTSSGTTVTILGYANAHGTRYFLLPLTILLPILITQKPMGAGAMSLQIWQILSLLEVLDLNSLTTSPIGPIMLALLGSFHFFKTGHQATPSSIQWETAFLASRTIVYPWSPLLIAINAFGAQILAAVSVPLIILWKQEPRKKYLLKNMVVALSWHIAYYATIGLATTLWAGHLRRHLMLFRIFSPKFMTASIVLVVVDLIGIVVGLWGMRGNTLSVGEIFGWG